MSALVVAPSLPLALVLAFAAALVATRTLALASLAMVLAFCETLGCALALIRSQRCESCDCGLGSLLLHACPHLADLAEEPGDLLFVEFLLGKGLAEFLAKSAEFGPLVGQVLTQSACGST